jgi:hypothetical protein
VSATVLVAAHIIARVHSEVEGVLPSAPGANGGGRDAEVSPNAAEGEPCTPNPSLAGYLTQALDHELSVVQQYLTQACLCRLWREAGLAGYFRKEADEEQGHAARLICHLLSLGLAPNGTRLRPVRPGRDLREMLRWTGSSGTGCGAALPGRPALRRTLS